MVPTKECGHIKPNGVLASNILSSSILFSILFSSILCSNFLVRNILVNHVPAALGSNPRSAGGGADP